MEMGIIKMVWVSKYMSRNTEFRNVKIVIELFVAFNYHILILKSTCCGIKVKNRPLKWFRHWARPELKLASQWWWLHWFYVSSLLGMGKHTRYYSLPLQLLPCSLPFLPFLYLIFTLFCQVQPHHFFLFPCFSSPFLSHFLSEDLPVLLSYFLLPFFAFIFFHVLFFLLSFLFLFLLLALSFSILYIPFTFPLTSSQFFHPFHSFYFSSYELSVFPSFPFLLLFPYLLSVFPSFQFIFIFLFLALSFSIISIPFYFPSF